MRADQLVVPASEHRLREFFRHPLAQPRRALARGRRVVVDVGVIVVDDRGIGCHRALLILSVRPLPRVTSSWNGRTMALHAAVCSLSPTELGFTRVRLFKWPKSEISDFGWRGRG